MTERRARRAKTDTTETCMGIDGSQAVQATMMFAERANSPSKVGVVISSIAGENQWYEKETMRRKEDKKTAKNNERSRHDER